MGMRRIVVIGSIVLAFAAACAFVLRERYGAPDAPSVPPEQESVPAGPPAFTWSYAASERDGIPYTEISLTARYEDGTSRTEALDTVEGSCNDYDAPASDSYAKSTMIICYYAGLGRYYKVVEEEGAYLVQRRVFEEAGPEYDSPVQAFETIARF